MSTKNEEMTQGMTNPPLRVCRPQNVCGICLNYWTMHKVSVPTDLPPTNGYCPVPRGPGGSVPCFKVDDLVNCPHSSEALDFMLLDPYPLDMEDIFTKFSLNRVGPTGTRCGVKVVLLGVAWTKSF